MENDVFNNISATLPDWEREKPRRFWDPGRKLLSSIRQYQRWKEKRGLIAWFFRNISLVRHRFWTVITAADISVYTKIGGGLSIPHPNGIVIHSEAVIGVNCLIHQQVTIGMKNDSGRPVIKGHVDIGAGAKILGNVVLHEHSMIGANAVVTHDVQRFEVVAGIPARVIKKLDPSKPKQP